MTRIVIDVLTLTYWHIDIDVLTLLNPVRYIYRPHAKMPRRGGGGPPPPWLHPCRLVCIGTKSLDAFLQSIDSQKVGNCESNLLSWRSSSVQKLQYGTCHARCGNATYVLPFKSAHLRPWALTATWPQVASSSSNTCRIWEYCSMTETTAFMRIWCHQPCKRGKLFSYNNWYWEEHSYLIHRVYIVNSVWVRRPHNCPLVSNWDSEHHNAQKVRMAV